MITKWIQFTVVSERTCDFERELGRVEEASRKEIGCAFYSAFRSTEDGNVFTVLETWESAEAFDAHRQTTHVAEFKERCGGMILEKSGMGLRAIGAEK